jgi:hypothetical protein
MNILAEFDGYKLRAADSVADLETLYDWISRDEVHRDIFTPQFFLSGVLGGDSRPSCYALEDENGAVFYIRLSRAARVRMQFPPGEDSKQKSRILRGLLHGMAFLETELKKVGCEEWIFDTANPALKKAAERLLGFTESTHELVRLIAHPAEKEVQDVRRTQ